MNVIAPKDPEYVTIVYLLYLHAIHLNVILPNVILMNDIRQNVEALRVHYFFPFSAVVVALLLLLSLKRNCYL